MKNKIENAVEYLQLDIITKNLNITMDLLFSILNLLEIPVLQIGENSVISKTSDNYLSVYNEIRLYCRYGLDIEDRIISFIKENQPVKEYTIAKTLHIPRKQLKRILTNITFRDDNLWGSYSKHQEWLQYGWESFV